MDETVQAIVKEQNIEDDIYWHSGFFEAIQLELIDYENHLEFINEYQLSKEALKIDVLIVENKTDVKIEKNIGRIFKKYNIIEYKSESDYISIDSYYKNIAYGCLYKAFSSNVEIDQITISLVAYKRPRKLIEYLLKKRGFSVSDTQKGIIYVYGDIFPLQIIVINKKLPESENVFLRNLRGGLTQTELSNVALALYKTDKFERRFTYLDIIIHANLNLIEEAGLMDNPDIEKHESIKYLSLIFKRLYEKKGWLPDYVQIIREADRSEAETARLEAEAAKLEKKELEAKAIEQSKAMLDNGIPEDLVIKYSVLPREQIELLLKG